MSSSAQVVLASTGPPAASGPASRPAAGPTSASSPRAARPTSSAGASGPSPAKASPAPAAQPRSGTATGALVNTEYGAVQVRITFVGKRITAVRATHLTDSSDTSVSISAQAAPILRQEAMTAQSAQVDMVSGATYTSAAYQQSLQSAIDAAHLG
ncbi:MAG: FMN-binding protein [Dermatophilaceae bacterium]